MSGVAGIELKFAAKRGITWGTAEACGANDGILILPGSLKKSMEDKVDDSLGLFWPTDSDRGPVVATEGGRLAYLRYDSLDLLIASFMGASGSPTYTTAVDSGTAESGTNNTLTDLDKNWTTNVHATNGRYVTILTGTGAGQTRKIVSNTATILTVASNWSVNPGATSTYEISGSIATHNYDLADNLDGIFVTIAMNEKIGIKEATSLKLSDMIIKGSTGGGPLEINFKGPAYNITWNSAINTLNSFANVTYREQANRILYSQGVMRLNAQGGSALDTADIIYPDEFELTSSRKLKGVYGAGGSFDNIDEPTNDGTPEVKLKLKFPRYTSAQPFLDWADSTVRKKMDMTFTGALIGGSSYRKMVLSLPNLKYANVDCPEVRGILEMPIEYNCLSAASAPSGMTGITKPFRLALTNTFGGDPLQAGN
ncbi:MAG: hypothetical protein HZA14_12485 [Nitrospirae bacterium]|nr:hypothetical protein [Nitrospirota bacterium]